MPPTTLLNKIDGMDIQTKSAGFIFGPEAHYVDHLATLCSLLKIPLIITEEEIAALCQKYYPDLEVRLASYQEAPAQLVALFDQLFCCTPRLLFDEVFFFAQKLLGKRLKTIWCPHGNSDKGHLFPFMEALENEEIALVYGQKMIDFLAQKRVLQNLKSTVVTGNYRHLFYQNHKNFYDEIISKEILSKVERSSKMILFAPTWQDSEKSSSFFDACPLLLQQLPEDCSLIVKLHPHLKKQEEFRTVSLIKEWEKDPRILFLEDFPPIYPLLDLVDMYIGDMSSIGYDFLAFNKPMFFLNQNNRDVRVDPGLFLFRCGVEIKREQYGEIFKIMHTHLLEDANRFSLIRKELYQYTFGKSNLFDPT